VWGQAEDLEDEPYVRQNFTDNIRLITGLDE
jgi:hypothetical protein